MTLDPSESITEIRVGHCLDLLEAMPPRSVHMVWTSPPYWGLRDYETEPLAWGGNPACRHAWGDRVPGDTRKHGQRGETSAMKGRGIAEAAVQGRRSPKGQFCRHCAAWLGEHGQEPTMALWLHHEVLVFRAVRRVLRDDGTLWINIGDAYATSPNGRAVAEIGDRDNRTFRDKPMATGQRVPRAGRTQNGGNTASDIVRNVRAGDTTLALKNRLNMPMRLVLALQDDGWFHRDEIVWHKLNPMPSSVKDRTTPAHEMLYMLSKSDRYFYDDIGISEPVGEGTIARYRSAARRQQKGGFKQETYDAHLPGAKSRTRSPQAVLESLAGPQTKVPQGWDTSTGEGQHGTVHHLGRAHETLYQAGMRLTRQKRSVWSIALEPFRGAHFATAPTALVAPCIMAGTSERGVCPACGAPWTRKVKRRRIPRPDVVDPEKRRREDQYDGSSNWPDAPDCRTLVETTGWRPGCKCPAAAPVAALVLDIFGGSGTTALVANRLGRNGLLFERKPEYAEMARVRLREDLHRVVSQMPEPLGADLPLLAVLR